MVDFLSFLTGCWNECISLLSALKINIAGISVPFWGLMIGFMVTGLIISVFWRGAKQ